MKVREESFHSLDRPWSEFSKAWKKTRHKPSENSIHDLRVNTRRLIENLELARPAFKKNGLKKLQRRLKKFLNITSALRDLQVQLETVTALPRSPVIDDFTRHLKRRERKKVSKIENKIRRKRNRRLADMFSKLRRNSIQSRYSMRSILEEREREFREARRRFEDSQPHSEEALHAMRIALKKLRYTMEAAQAMLTPAENEKIEAMRAFQKLMGDSRDLELLRVELGHWANKKGKKLAVIPALTHLQDKRQSLLSQLLESSHELDQILEIPTAVTAA
jgi:CHAD domain-containing protein